MASFLNNQGRQRHVPQVTEEEGWFSRSWRNTIESVGDLLSEVFTEELADSDDALDPFINDDSDDGATSSGIDIILDSDEETDSFISLSHTMNELRDSDGRLSDDLKRAKEKLDARGNKLTQLGTTMDAAEGRAREMLAMAKEKRECAEQSSMRRSRCCFGWC